LSPAHFAAKNAKTHTVYGQQVTMRERLGDAAGKNIN
jgi:hypothetical protein